MNASWGWALTAAVIAGLRYTWVVASASAVTDKKERS